MIQKASFFFSRLDMKQKCHFRFSRTGSKMQTEPSPRLFKFLQMDRLCLTLGFIFFFFNQPQKVCVFSCMEVGWVQLIPLLHKHHNNFVHTVHSLTVLPMCLTTGDWLFGCCCHTLLKGIRYHKLTPQQSYDEIL